MYVLYQEGQGRVKKPKGIDCMEVEPDTAVQAWYCLVPFVQWRNKEIAYMEQSKFMKIVGNLVLI